MSKSGILTLLCLGYTAASYSLEDVLEIMKTLDTRHGELNTEATVAEWNYNTNLTNHNSEIQTNKSKILENFEADSFKLVSEFDEDVLKDKYDLKRQIKKVTKLSAILKNCQFDNFMKAWEKVPSRGGIY